MSHHHSNYYLTYRLARGVDLKSRYGKAVYWFTVGSFALVVLVLAADLLALIGALILDHFGVHLG